MNRCPTVGLSDATQKSWVTAPNGSLHLVAYIYEFPGHLKIAGVATSLKHTQKHLQVIQVLIDHIFSS